MGRQLTKRNRGLTLIESLLMLFVLSIIGLATGVGLQAATRVPPANDRMLVVDAKLNSDMDYWLSLAWQSTKPAAWPTTFPYTRNDTVSLQIGGKAVTLNRTTTIHQWDPTNISGNTSPKTDFFRVVVTIDQQSLTFYVSDRL